MFLHFLNKTKTRKATNFKVYLGIIILVWIGILLGCSSQNQQDNEAKSPTKEKFIVLDSLYKYDIDSAILYAKLIELDILKSDEPEIIVDYYTFQSELNQYLYLDMPAALKYSSKVLEVISLNPEVQIINPYVFINIGNILLANSLFSESIDMYNYSLEIEGITDLTKALIYNNIGIAYLKSNNCKMSLSYFNKAFNEVEDKTHIMLAQNFSYKIEHSIQCNNFDSIDYYFDSGLEILNKNGLIGTKCNNSSLCRNEFYCYQIGYEFFKNIANYYAETDLTKSLIYNKTSLNFAHVLKKNELLGDTHLNIAQIFLQLGSIDSAVNSAYLSYEYFSNTGKYEKLIESLELISTNCDNCDNQYYSDLASVYMDSLDLTHFSNINDQLSIAKANVVISLNHYKQLQTQQDKIIKNQRLVIIVITLLLFIIFIFTVLIIRNRNSLSRTQKQLALRTIEVSTLSPEKLSLKHQDKYVEDLERLMLSEKKYLDKNIKLEDLAAGLYTNTSYMSRIINDNYDMNFNDYINSLRIKEACYLISSAEDFKNSFTIETLYDKVGFKNRSTFYNAFKKFTGVTPAVYVKLRAM